MRNIIITNSNRFLEYYYRLNTSTGLIYKNLVVFDTSHIKIVNFKNIITVMIKCLFNYVNNVEKYNIYLSR